MAVATIVGGHLITIFKTVLEFFYMLQQTLLLLVKPPIRVKEIFKYLNFVANESAITVFICVSFAASVTIIEASFHMKLVVQNDSMVPGFASVLILRELGSVVACLLIGSRVGAGWAAEVGSMKVTEQIDALKLLGIDPVQFLVVPRFIASIIGCIILSAMANIICLFFAMLISIISLGYTVGGFLSAMRVFVSLQDLWFATIKGGIFGATVPLIACFSGFKCKPGAEGVGIATTNAVVAIAVSIIILDFVLGYIFSHFY